MTAATKPALYVVPASDRTQRDTLVIEHLHLVKSIALNVRRSLSVHMELDDLVHAGTMGLFDAATKYREDKEVIFSTYAKHRIRGAILDSIRQGDWASRDLRDRFKEVESLKASLTEKLGREPLESEIASEMGISPKRWQALMVDFRTVNAAAASAHAYQSDDAKASLEVVDTTCPTPETLFARAELRAKLRGALSTLPEKHQKVVEMYYEKECTMKEIGSALGVNESRVSQIHKSALERMQIALGAAGLCSAAAA